MIIYRTSYTHFQPHCKPSIINFVASPINVCTVRLTPTDLSDHYILDIQLLSQRICQLPQQPNLNPIKYYIYNPQNDKIFSEQLQKINWEELKNINDIESLGTEFMNRFLTCYNSAYTTITRKKRNTTKKIIPWYTPEIAKKILQRNKLYKAYLCTPSDVLKQEYLNYKNHLRNLIKVTKKKYYEMKFTDVQSAKNNWSKLKQLLYPFHSGKDRKLINTLIYKQQHAKDDHDIVNLFSIYMTDLQEQILPIPNINVPTMNNVIDESFYLADITIADIVYTLSKMRNKESVDCDNIKTIILIKHIDLVIQPLTYLYNKIILTKDIPTIFKKAITKYFYKKGNPENPANYRPITITSIFIKIFEVILLTRFTIFIDKHKLINSNQFGFQVNKSTQDLLEQLLINIYTEFDYSNYVTICSCDVQKAFDSITHTLLLQKLYTYAFRGVVYQLIANYLKDSHNNLPYIYV